MDEHAHTGSITGSGPRIVVGIDGSKDSLRALRRAAQAAPRFGAHLELVGAWDYPAGYGWAATTEWNPKDDMARELQNTVHEVFGHDRQAGLEVLLCKGNAAKVLLDRSQDALMLVVGSRGHGGFAGLLLGAVSANVAEHATCPVLVIHGADGPPTAIA